MFNVMILTVSDKGFTGERADESGPLLRRMLEQAGYRVVLEEIMPDERDILSGRMAQLCDEKRGELLLTTGGTGFAPRDITPEATMDIAQRAVPGIPEAMRAYSLRKTNRSMLSRGVAAIRGETLIVNLPGSPKGARENLECILPALGHGLEILTGRAGECAAK